MPSRRVWFLLRFGLKTGIDLVQSGMVFKGTTGVYQRSYRFNSKWIRKKEKYANSKWILRNLFRRRSNLSNDGIISQRPGLKTEVKNNIFWPEMGLGFLGTSRHTPSRIPRSTPPDLIIGNYSKHPLIRRRGKSLVAEISRFNTPCRIQEPV